MNATDGFFYSRSVSSANSSTLDGVGKTLNAQAEGEVCRVPKARYVKLRRSETCGRGQPAGAESSRRRGDGMSSGPRRGL